MQSAAPHAAAVQQPVSCSSAACIMQRSSLYHAAQQPVSCSAAACIMQRSSLYHAAPQPSTVLQKAVEAQG